ncbi:Facilitated trehalose transporter Tret1 [Eumeta japonica]|uniref:Facilitated trehalose transporter Tret1 n=1 Tax=Eumeta variegata TaxID=151549 RepID=A0A4C1YKE8_EUMVA|nr:Facilitated trehalose transporter Tret1 [Eumeta japonica]
MSESSGGPLPLLPAIIPFLTLLANLSLFSYGLQAGWISPMSKVLQSEEGPSDTPISDSTMLWIASTMTITAVVATPIYSYLLDAFGRKMCIITIGIFQLSCWAIKLFYASTAGLIIARAACGVASGACFTVVPVYLKEISQEDNRGAIGSLVMLTQSFGFVTMYAMGPYLEYYTVLWVVIALPAVMVLLMLMAPESPAYLIKIGKIEEAKAALALLRGKDKNEKYICNETLLMITQEEHFKSLPTLSYRTILSEKAYRNGLVLLAIVMTVHACSGNFAVFTYAATIVKTSGVTVDPDLQTVAFPLVMAIGGILPTIFMDKMRRKTLFAICLVVTGASHSVVASVILLHNHDVHVPGGLAVGAITVSAFANGAGILPVPYVIMSELFNFQVRARLIGICVTYAWFLCFVQLSIFGPISGTFGMHTMFFGFAAINIVGVTLVWILLPETKGKSVEEIESELRGKKRINDF